MWFRTGQVAGCRENGNDPSGYIKFREFLDCPMICSMQLASNSLQILTLSLFITCQATLHCSQHRYTNVTKLCVQDVTFSLQGAKLTAAAAHSSAVQRSVPAVKPKPRWFCFHLMDHDMGANTGKKRTNVMWHPQALISGSILMRQTDRQTQ